MEIKLEVAPLSVNKAWKGRRFKTPDYDRFEKEVSIWLPWNLEPVSKDEVFVYYVFYIHNYANADAFNMEKTLSDMLVKRGYMLDDRYVRGGYVRKERIEKDQPEWILIKISPYTGQDIGV